MTPAQFWAIEQGNQQNRQEFMQGQMNNVMSGLAGLAQSYSDNKAMEAKASSYDKIGDILGSAMFKGNDMAMNALGELKKSKDPREKVMGYEALLSFAGPYSNFMNAQGRMEQAPALQDQRTNDQRDIMYERERLQREREAMNTPQGPTPVNVPTAMRRFNKPI
jgi:hypothetical protein